MCGIAGLVGCGEEALIQRMCRTMRHRGPDDEGYYADEAMTMGMVRLSIIDVAGGRQPMTDEHGRYHVIFNGEIYNFQALRQMLAANGHRFTTRSDTEVLVHLYEDRQERCVELLNGDFAFAIWDRRQRRLFAARDRLGVKPFYYWHDGGRFAFASELKALLHVPGVERTVDPQALDDYLAFLYIPSPKTVFRSVRKLPPGCRLTLQDGVLRVERYWRLPAVEGPPQGSAEDLREMILERLRRAVELRLVSDVPLGAFLSGGIDSSTVVGLMSRLIRDPVRTFSLGFAAPYDTYNELPAAQQAAEAFHTRHRACIVQPDLAYVLPQAVWHLDEPLADSSALLTYLISREAKQDVTVALTGIGGDELFGGYPRYLGAWASERLAWLPPVVRRGLAACARWIPQRPTSRNTGGRLARFLRELPLPPEERYVAWVTFMARRQREALYAGSLREALRAHDAAEACRELLRQSRGGYLDRIGAFDLQTYLPDDLLMLGDKMSMAHALELRVPFCDHELVEAAASVPMTERLAGFRFKSLLKQAVQGLLPPALLRRPKQGFMLPLSAWLRGPLEGLIRETLAPKHVERRGWFVPQRVSALIEAHRQGDARLAHAVYALLVLELWCHRYLDQAP